ncbi:MAG: Dihydroneopterin aldolase [Firmicutes bacterium]|nr:Dihydroneopterin aldolase [candidate division NPL-UPA2 bacterium]MBT9154122.1 Dihydroneopterin aldolase [candidate division NPL-UPA2 bacterium]MBT9155860.1 Dihydroneopterin aldolase [candidate division NPL-UPA2 bacterium]
MADKLLLANMLFYGYHGALPEETVLGQRFSVSLEIECDMRPAADNDDLALALNYAAVCKTVQSIMEGSPCRLLETVAERIAAAVLAFGALSVRVTVKKLHPPLALCMDFAGVEIERRQVSGARLS